jgi:hypothetical protein
MVMARPSDSESNWNELLADELFGVERSADAGRKA